MADGQSTANAGLMLAAGTGTNANNVQAHTGPPGAAGTANVSSVTTRPAVTWAAPSGGSVAANGTPPAWASWAGTNGEVLTDVSFWSASSAGTFGFSAALSAPVTMNIGDSFTLTSITVTIPTAS
jgi:hypothetical protein